MHDIRNIDTIYLILYSLASLFIIYLSIFFVIRSFRIIKIRIQFIIRSFKKDKETPIKKLLYKDDHLSDFQKMIIYDNLDINDKYELGIPCYTMRMKEMVSYMEAVIVFAESRLFIMPVHKSFALPVLSLYYGEIMKYSLRKGLIKDKLRIYTDKERLGILLDKRYIKVNDKIPDYIKYKIDQNK